MNMHVLAVGGCIFLLLACSRADAQATLADAAEQQQPAVIHRLLDEGVLSIVAGFAAEGIAISAKTALRWALAGTGGVRLESMRIGGRRVTSRPAIRRFLAAQQREASPAAQVIDRAAADVFLAAHGMHREVRS